MFNVHLLLCFLFSCFLFFRCDAVRFEFPDQKPRVDNTTYLQQTCTLWRHAKTGVFEGCCNGMHVIYFSDITERIHASTLGPHYERIAVFIACDGTTDIFLYRYWTYRVTLQYHRLVFEYLAHKSLCKEDKQKYMWRH